MHERERALHPLVCEVGEIPAELRGGQHSLVDQRSRREARDHELRAGRALGHPSDHVELALEREQVAVEIERRTDEQLAHHRSEQAGMRTCLALFHRNVAPAEHDLPLRGDGGLEELFELLAAERLLRQEAHGNAEAARRRQLETDRRAQERIRKLDEDACSVTGLCVGAGRSAVLEVLERAQRLRDRLVAAHAVEPRHECDAAGVVLERRVVKALLPHRPYPPPDCWLVRRGEGDAGPASALAGAT